MRVSTGSRTLLTSEVELELIYSRTDFSLGVLHVALSFFHRHIAVHQHLCRLSARYSLVFLPCHQHELLLSHISVPCFVFFDAL